ncbi:hypothetical protein I553_0335 [Mycobacterium xenopi 4042]|uniref:Uncharacterized protein n=1 Tax=Mycobacterium xenopi 4042 TaxID=1299334 RepID=X7YKB2_MYCXE|nr:hypothetical protein I553_0335 [Mycobacterium xenopi 4042]
MITVKFPDVVAVPLQWGSALRHRRVFHPAGVMAAGQIERLAPPDQGLPIGSCDVVARISKGSEHRVDCPTSSGWPGRCRQRYSPKRLGRAVGFSRVGTVDADGAAAGDVVGGVHVEPDAIALQAAVLVDSCRNEKQDRASRRVFG